MDSNATARALYDEGVELASAGACGAALAAFDRSLALSPGNAGTLFQKGFCLADLGRHAEAAACFHQAAANPRYAVGRTFSVDPAFFHRLRAEGLAAPVAALAPAEWLTDARPGADDLCVYASCDANYLATFGPAFLASLAETTPGVFVHLHLVDPPPGIDAVLCKMVAAVDGMGIGLTAERPDFAGRDPDYIRTYLASIRFVRLPAVLAAYGRPVFACDIDVVFRRDLRAALGPYAAAGLVIRDVGRNELGPFNRYSAAALWLRPDAAQAFAADLAMYLAHFLALGQSHWLLDQAALFACLAHARGEGTLRPATFDPLLMSTDLDDAAAIWTVGGNTKYSNPKFVAEVEGRASR